MTKDLHNNEKKTFSFVCYYYEAMITILLFVYTKAYSLNDYLSGFPHLWYPEEFKYFKSSIVFIAWVVP